MTRPSKARVRQSFERAAPTYDSPARVQRQICDQLASLLGDLRRETMATWTPPAGARSAP